MSYVAVIAFYRDGSSKVHVDSSEQESMKTMNSIMSNKNVVSGYRKVVSDDLFIAYSNGQELVAKRMFNAYGIPQVTVRKPYNKPKDV